MIQGVKKGFTITELMLAMSFVSILLVAIATMTMQLSKIYTKGNTMRDLSSSGRTINDDFTHTFNSIPSFDWQSVKTSPTPGANYVQKQDGSGAFCSGTYSYLWNNAKTLNDPNSVSAISVRYKNTGVKDTSIRLVKVSDPNGGYCSGGNDWSQIERGDSGNKQTIDLLPEGESGLMLYGIQFNSDNNLVDEVTNQRVISISYVLGTKNDDGNVSVTSGGATCNPDNKSGQDYCAINKFDLTVRTLGRK